MKRGFFVGAVVVMVLQRGQSEPEIKLELRGYCPVNRDQGGSGTMNFSRIKVFSAWMLMTKLFVEHCT